jgi:hypothetical protein
MAKNALSASLREVLSNLSRRSQAVTTFEIISIYIPGLGLVAVVIAVTFKCVPLFRVTEVTYLSSIREIKKRRMIFY